jgi:hypothetical protein
VYIMWIQNQLFKNLLWMIIILGNIYYALYASSCNHINYLYIIIKRVNQLSSSPVEPIFVCAGSSKNKKSGALVAWSMKTMSACVKYYHKMTFFK